MIKYLDKRTGEAFTTPVEVVSSIVEAGAAVPVTAGYHLFTGTPTPSLPAGVSNNTCVGLRSAAGVWSTHALITELPSVVWSSSDGRMAHKRSTGGWQVFSAQTNPTQLQMISLSGTQVFAATALSDITGLSIPTVTGKRYNIKAGIIFQTVAATTGFRLGATFGAGTIAINVEIPLAAATKTLGVITASGGSVVSANVPAANTNYLCQLEGAFSPSANGTFQLRAATEIAASNATVRAGSFLQWAEV